MSMTRKDYELIAKVLLHQGVTYHAGRELDNYRHLCLALGRAFKIDNVRFDEAKFLAACGVEV